MQIEKQESKVGVNILFREVPKQAGLPSPGAAEDSFMLGPLCVWDAYTRSSDLFVNDTRTQVLRIM
jgi:hypothetical protein